VQDRAIDHSISLHTGEIEVAEKTQERPIVDLLKNMTTASVEASGLDAQTLALARIAALVAVDAPPASYLANLSAAKDHGVDKEHVRGVLAGIAPIVGTARVVAAAGNIARALKFSIEVGDALKPEKDS
jgi:alkylhydroperoxidase/carboxymuconolactone decarboxylase family protein YurZ